MKTNPITRAQHGDYTRVVTALFETYRTPISVYLYRVLDDWELAHDLTQETFLRAFRARQQFEQVENRRAWLYRVASNLAFTALKRRQRFAWLPWRQMDVRRLSQSDGTAQVERCTMVEQALAELSPTYRAPLLLFSYYGFTIREVAQMLELSEGAVKVRLHRARKMFRQAYQGENEENEEYKNAPTN